MVGLVSILAGEILYESIKFVIMLGLLVAAVFIGGALRKKKDAKKARIPIIAMTANAFAEDTQKVLSVGMNAHVAKPVDMNILIPTMMKYL